MENGKEPITPCTIQGRQGWGDKPTISDREVYGLTKREYFAGLAMQGLLANPNFQDNGSGASIPIQVTVSAIKYADELLKQLDNIK
jgi:hypothetical protein